MITATAVRELVTVATVPVVTMPLVDLHGHDHGTIEVPVVFADALFDEVCLHGHPTQVAVYYRYAVTRRNRTFHFKSTLYGRARGGFWSVLDDREEMVASGTHEGEMPLTDLLLRMAAASPALTA